MKNDGLPAYTRKDYTYAESTTDGISGITGALAALAEYFTTNQVPPPAAAISVDLSSSATCICTCRASLRQPLVFEENIGWSSLKWVQCPGNLSVFW